MIGPHDLGGRRAGPIRPETDEPVFHADWEKSVFGAVICTIVKGAYNIDEFRAGIEQMDTASYLAASYYEKWLYTLERNLAHAGVLTAADIAARERQLSATPNAATATGDDAELLATIDWLLPNGASNRRELDHAPRFDSGAEVRSLAVEPRPHTRNPGYCQGKTGIVRRVHDAYPLPDAVVRGEAERPEYVYAVGFSAAALWPDGEPGTEVLVDLWESYLEPVTT